MLCHRSSLSPAIHGMLQRAKQGHLLDKLFRRDGEQDGLAAGLRDLSVGTCKSALTDDYLCFNKVRPAGCLGGFYGSPHLLDARLDLPA